ncbi:hypothetical protein CROQUDRAFT_651086 [Cronartium quercuum f. sp. fusiforme G11]|uniref:Uncharacterized protein n=1 Tax=Cronartium quercuum f. sp. fusiforme G11 TaxID=708437 RepID=A0A9P6NWG2_9BASI|nr:hypothetical protein CROQUDRAFT_651086 [Cronartium quercuum f. sp. fusiforme G11]
MIFQGSGHLVYKSLTHYNRYLTKQRIFFGHLLRLPISLGGLLRHVRKVFKNRGADPILPYHTPSAKIADGLDLLEKGQAASNFQLRSGCCPLRKYLHRIKVEQDPRCEHCKLVETPTHSIAYCKKFEQQRNFFRMELKKAKVKVNSATAVLDNTATYPHLVEYIEGTERFEYLKSYTED